MEANEHNHQANEDVLSRRTRALLLGARASIEAAPRVAELMARELGTDEAWRKKAVEDYEKVAAGLRSETGSMAGIH